MSNVTLQPITVAVAISAAILCSCATGPKKSSVYYSPPSVAPVQQNISSAQSSVASARTHAVSAKQSVAAAVSAASQLKDESPALKLALETANTEIDALTDELDHTQVALQEAQTTTIPALETKIGQQTSNLNTCIDDKNTAITQRDAAQLQVKMEQAHAHKLKFWICLAAAALAGFVAFHFKGLLSLAGPYGLVAGLVGAPVAVFGVLWMLI